jgi:CyaY protein
MAEHGSTLMEENEFNRLAEHELQAIAEAIDASGIDCVAEFKADGVLEIGFADGARMVVNRHTAAREIWVAARSGGFHFRCRDGHWLGSRDGRELRTVLSELLSQSASATVELPRC